MNRCSILTPRTVVPLWVLDRTVQVTQIVFVGTMVRGGRSAHIDAGCSSTGGRRVAGSNPVAPTLIAGASAAQTARTSACLRAGRISSVNWIVIVKLTERMPFGVEATNW